MQGWVGLAWASGVFRSSGGTLTYLPLGVPACCECEHVVVNAHMKPDWAVFSWGCLLSQGLKKLR